MQYVVCVRFTMPVEDCMQTTGTHFRERWLFLS